jgi:hypothetical protein
MKKGKVVWFKQKGIGSWWDRISSDAKQDCLEGGNLQDAASKLGKAILGDSDTNGSKRG